MAQDERAKENEVQTETAELTEAELETLAGGASGSPGATPSPLTTNLKPIGLALHNY
jgi:hypothetical protein